MNKHQLLKKIDSAWQQLKESYSGLSESQMMHPGVTGEWSIKDILGHVTTWEEEALKYLPMVMQERRPPRYKDLYGGMDSFNAMMTEKKHNLSISEILKELDTTHQELIAFLNTIPEEMVASGTRFRHRLRLDTYSHYPKHTKAILEWSFEIVKR
jgi:hypothetical protein